MRWGSGATPHTRGSTPVLLFLPSSYFGYPAYAGIDLGGPVASSGPNGLPRIRGDRPGGSLVPSGFMEATPHTRGSTFISTGLSVDQYGYPAYAGIDLHIISLPFLRIRLPRIRGDRPKIRTESLGRGMATPHTRGSTFITTIVTCCG